MGKSLKKVFAKTALILPPIFRKQKTHRNWVIRKYLILVILLLLLPLSLFFLQTGYQFSSPNGNYSIQTDYQSIQIKPIPKNKMILLFCFAAKDPLSLEYFQSLKELAMNYGDLEVVGVLNELMSSEDFEKFIQQHEISFLVLNPRDKKHFVEDLYRKMQEQIQKVQSQSHYDSGQKAPSIPFLLLYNSEHKLYSHYQGAVVQEMIMFDIAQMTNSNFDE